MVVTSNQKKIRKNLTKKHKNLNKVKWQFWFSYFKFFYDHLARAGFQIKKIQRHNGFPPKKIDF